MVTGLTMTVPVLRGIKKGERSIGSDLPDLSNLRLRASGVSPAVKASESREGFDLGLAFQVPQA